jgi:cyclopropane-fatty-acyl-phospholipid synthase
VAPLIDRISARSAPAPRDDRRNIAAHYDLSNDFFSLMLDETMAYSCAIFDPPGISLHEAQLVKFDRIAAALDLEPSMRVLEIGTGWGGLAIELARRHGVTVTTTTISAAQAGEARRRVARAAMAHRIEVVESDWRELAGSYDRIVSVEMVEAVDWRLHGEFFAQLERLLEPQGRALVQAITIDPAAYDRARMRRDFIRELVFPGGCIPSLPALRSAVARHTALRVVDVIDIGEHYAPTLRCWAANLERQRDAVAALALRPETLRLFALYLAYCEAAYLERHISDVQIILESVPAVRAAGVSATSERRVLRSPSPDRGCVAVPGGGRRAAAR